MISTRSLIIIIVALVLGFLMIVRRVKKDKLEVKYAIPWLLLDVLLIVIVSIPGCLEWLSGLMGIYDVTNMVFFLAFAFTICLCFFLTNSASKDSDRIRKLTQTIALNEYRSKKQEKQENIGE